MLKEIVNKIYLKILKRKDSIKWAKKLGVKIGKNCRLIDVEFSTEPYLITIGNHVSATKTRFETHDGAVWLFRERNTEIDIIDKITIGNNVYIGYGCLILPGTTIKNNVVIGAGSIVKGTYEEGYVYAGTPARKICSLDDYIKKNEKKIELTKSMSKIEKKIFYERKYQSSI